MVTTTTALLEAGQQAVRIVCFGDSITGVYYHTGGRRAYSDMLGIALRRVYPLAQVSMTNSGMSGNTTADGLQRLQRDVLDHRPHLVTVMFGMNDVVRLPIGDYHRNLHSIAEQCQSGGAEVVLCTPNSVYPEDDSRPMRVLAHFAETVRRVAGERGLVVADCWQAYEDLRARDQRAWQLLLSETIHPNMNGHKVFAEEITRSITGERISLAQVPPPIPAIPATVARASTGEPVRVTAMPPFDALVEPALREAVPGAQVQMTRWPVQGQSVTQIEAWARDEIGWQHFQAHPDDLRPHLVLIAVPPQAKADSEEEFIRSYSDMLNCSLSFATREWDCVAVLPSVTSPDLSADARHRESLAREVIRGQDIGFLQRPDGDTSPPGALLARWIRAATGSCEGDVFP